MNASFITKSKILISARNKVYQTANFAMVEAYWNIGKSIIEEQGGDEKAEYGTGLLKELSKQMILSILVYTFSQECSTLCCLL